MAAYDNYEDVLTENSAGRHAFGSSLVVIVLLSLVLLAVSL